MASSQHKRRGFLQGKLFSCCGTSEASTNAQYTSRVRPNLSSTSIPSITCLVDNQDSNPRPTQKVSFLVPAEHDCNSINKFENCCSAVGDENVDMKAAIYISSVRERFKLERMSSERKNQHDHQFA